MSKDIRVVPAILTDDPQALETMVRQTEAFTTYAQFDVMDGRFVPSRSINAGDIARLSPGLVWEAHLMVMEPRDWLEDYRRAGAEKVVFHYEATVSPREVIALARKLGIKIGLAVNPETAIDAIEPLVGDIDSVLFLSVNPGFYGSKYIPGVLHKVKEFHRLYPDMQIDIDGGIKEANIAEIARSGVDTICVGSAIFAQPEPAESYRRLLVLARANTPL